MEILARDCGLSQQAMIAHTLRYLDHKERDIWSITPAARGLDWDRFKTEILALYPGADDTNRYTASDLKIYAEHAEAIPMQNQLQLGEYY